VNAPAELTPGPLLDSGLPRTPGNASTSACQRCRPWDDIDRAVALAMARHRPAATATEADYHLVMGHLTQLLWRLGVGDQALQTLGRLAHGSGLGVGTMTAEAAAAAPRQA
jgi:hypothetical protein